MGLIRLLLFVIFPFSALAQPASPELLKACADGNTFSCQRIENDASVPPAQREWAAGKRAQAEAAAPARAFWQLMGFVFWGAVIVGIVYLVKKARRQARDEEFAKLPKDGPMRVSIKEIFAKPGTFNSKQIPCSLSINVVISQADWKAIADAGLMKATLFYGDGISGEMYDPDNLRPWHVEDLKRPTTAGFWNADRMRQAKEQLIDHLHNLRTAIDAQREGPQTERLEI